MTKTIVITGASAGIGRALAEECFQRGYHLGLTGQGQPTHPLYIAYDRQPQGWHG